MSGTADVTDPVAWTSQLSAMLSSGRAVSDMSDAETLVTRHVGGELAEMEIFCTRHSCSLAYNHA